MSPHHLSHFHGKNSEKSGHQVRGSFGGVEVIGGQGLKEKQQKVPMTTGNMGTVICYLKPQKVSIPSTPVVILLDCVETQISRISTQDTVQDVGVRNPQMMLSMGTLSSHSIFSSIWLPKFSPA